MFDYNKYSEIQQTIKKSGKKTKIIAISKNHPLNQVQEAISRKVEIFGENRVQEAKVKFEQIKQNNNLIKLHLTGPLQTNKVKQALDLFDVFHTVDREKLLKEIIKFPEKLEGKSFFIQVNTGKEVSKSGIFPEDVGSFFSLCKSYGLINIEGLMCIPPINENPKKHFLLVKKIAIDLGLGGLSIGMSNDYLDALEFDPIYIRLGTLLFGKRI
jgi:PLP dependent protein